MSKRIVRVSGAARARQRRWFRISTGKNTANVEVEVSESGMVLAKSPTAVWRLDKTFLVGTLDTASLSSTTAWRPSTISAGVAEGVIDLHSPATSPLPRDESKGLVVRGRPGQRRTATTDSKQGHPQPEPDVENATGTFLLDTDALAAVNAWLRKTLERIETAEHQPVSEHLLTEVLSVLAARHGGASVDDMPAGVFTDTTSPDDKVVLDSPTGPVEYELPFTLDDETCSSGDVGSILSPTGKVNRTIAKQRRENSDLLALKIGQYYRFPTFQLDTEHHCIRPGVAYANTKIGAVDDPWGTLDWWYSPDRTMNGRRPVDLAIADELTHEDVDRTISVDSRGMW